MRVTDTKKKKATKIESRNIYIDTDTKIKTTNINKGSNINILKTNIWNVKI